MAIAYLESVVHEGTNTLVGGNVPDAITGEDKKLILGLGGKEN